MLAPIRSQGGTALLSLATRTLQFLVFHALVRVVDAVYRSKTPKRAATPR